MDKQFFKCHCGSQYCLFRWRPGSSTVWNMLMFVVIILTPSECFPPSWCIQGNPITLTCSRYCIENITKFKSVKIYSWIWLILIVYRYTLALKSFLVKIFILQSLFFFFHFEGWFESTESEQACGFPTDFRLSTILCCILQGTISNIYFYCTSAVCVLTTR